MLHGNKVIDQTTSEETLTITVAVVTRPHHQSTQLNVTLSDVTDYLCNVTYVVPLPILREIARRYQKILKSTEIRSIHLIKHILQIYRMTTFFNVMYQISMLHMLLIIVFSRIEAAFKYNPPSNTSRR